MARKMNEGVRKFIVSVKRNPHRIGLVAFAVSFVYYSLNLTCISNTTAKIQGAGMGLCGFVTMLFSILGLVSYLNAFPHRKKPKVAVLVLMGFLVGCVLFADIRYRGLIFNAVTRADNPLAITENTMYIAKAYNMLLTHIVMLIVSSVFTALTPVFRILLNKINTSVNVDSYGKMNAIDISQE